jgi:hypothetical protein
MRCRRFIVEGNEKIAQVARIVTEAKKRIDRDGEAFPGGFDHWVKVYVIDPPWDVPKLLTFGGWRETKKTGEVAPIETIAAKVAEVKATRAAGDRASRAAKKSARTYSDPPTPLVTAINPVRHVATVLADAKGKPVSLDDLAAGYEHNPAADLSRIIEHEENVDNEADAKLWLVSYAVGLLGKQQVECDGQLCRLRVPFADLRYRGNPITRYDVERIRTPEQVASDERLLTPEGIAARAADDARLRAAGYPEPLPLAPARNAPGKRQPAPPLAEQGAAVLKAFDGWLVEAIRPRGEAILALPMNDRAEAVIKLATALCVPLGKITEQWRRVD